MRWASALLVCRLSTHHGAWMEARSTTPQTPPRKPKRGYTKHGTTSLRRALVRSRKLDKQTRAGKALTEWRASLVKDVGGEAALSTQCLALVELPSVRD